MTKQALTLLNHNIVSSPAVNGCMNDALRMSELLKDHDYIVRCLSDDHDDWENPTKKKICEYLEWLCSDRQAGDSVFFSYAGHGTQVVNIGQDSEPDNKDEAIVSSAIELISDDELKYFFSKLPSGVKATACMDCCHSGTLFDNKNVIIKGRKRNDEEVYRTGRSIPVSTSLEQTPIVGHRFISDTAISQYLSEKVGHYVQPSRQGIDSAQPELQSRSFSTTSSTEQRESVPSGDVCALISGCQADEYSYETTYSDGSVGGFFTRALIEQFGRDKSASYYDLVLKIRKVLAVQGVPQNPGLECATAVSETAFLS